MKVWDGLGPGCLKQMRWVFKRSGLQDWPESRWKREKPFMFSDFSGDFKIFGMKEPSARRLISAILTEKRLSRSNLEYDWIMLNHTQPEPKSSLLSASSFLFCIFHFRLNMSRAQPVSVKLWRPQSLHVTVSLWYMWFRSHNEETSTARLRRVYFWQALRSGGILGFVTRCRPRSCGVDSDLWVPLRIMRQPCGT